MKQHFHFRHVVYPGRCGNIKGRGWVGYKLNDKSNFDTVPNTWMRLGLINDEDKFKDELGFQTF